VVIGGDIHSFWNNDLKPISTDPASPTVATELVGTSITSPGVPYELFASFLPENPHVRFFESRKRGYVMVELARDRMTARFQTISRRRRSAGDAVDLAQLHDRGRQGRSAW